MSNAQIKKVRSSDIELKDKLVSVQRVTKVTKGGRTFSFSAIVVVGDSALDYSAAAAAADFIKARHHCCLLVVALMAIAIVEVR